MKEIIAVDADEVVSSEVDAIIAFSRDRLGLELAYDDFKEPGDYWGYYERFWGDLNKEPHEIFQEFLASPYKTSQKILESDVEVLARLKESYRLEIVTSRAVDFKEVTLEMLGKYAAGVFTNVHFVDLWSQPGKKATKAQICREIGAGYLIDDSPEHCNLAAEAGVTALLFGDWGWSRDKVLHPNIQRVSDWQEVAEYFDV